MILLGHPSGQIRDPALCRPSSHLLALLRPINLIMCLLACEMLENIINWDLVIAVFLAKVEHRVCQVFGTLQMPDE